MFLHCSVIIRAANAKVRHRIERLFWVIIFVAIPPFGDARRHDLSTVAYHGTGTRQQLPV